MSVLGTDYTAVNKTVTFVEFRFALWRKITYKCLVCLTLIVIEKTKTR